MSRKTRMIYAAAILALFAAPLQAVEIFWQGSGVTGTLTDPNYSDGVNTNLAPTSNDIIDFGGGGTATYSVAGPSSFQKLRVGHGLTTPGGVGTGNVTINNGAQVSLSAGASGAANASLWIGHLNNNGTLTLDGATTSLTVARLVEIGYGTNVNRSGTLNITNGASLIVTQGNIQLGEATSGTNGSQGHLNVNGNITQNDVAADLNIGANRATSDYNQTGGIVSIGDVVEVGAANGSGTSTGSSFTISGGTISHAGNFFVGRGASISATANINGGTINTGNRYLMGGGTGTLAVTNHTAGTLSTTLDLRVADNFSSATSDATYNLSGSGIINSTTGGIIGRQGVGKFVQTGGTANFNGAFSIGNRESATLAASGLYEISAGTLAAAAALNVAPKGTGVLRVIGDDATITVGGNFTVGNTADGTGTLEFKLETGDLLSQISVTGNATFSSGAILNFDTSLASPTQATYDLVTAASIVDSGITKNFPAGWDYHIITGGNGQILQAFQPPVGLSGDFNDDTKVDAADYVTWRKNEVANAPLSHDNGVGNQAARYDLWRANFGNPPSSGSGLNGAQVPEPTALVLLVLGLSSAMIIRCRNRHDVSI